MKTRFLDILIIFLLTFLVMNLFFWEDKKQTNTGVNFISQSKSYTIPASVKLDIENNSANNIKLNSCNDIKLKYSWEFLSIPKEFCKDLVIKSNEKITVDYSKYYSLFEQTWTYNFEIKYKDWVISTFEIENKWTISKIFTYFLYAPILNLMDFLIKITGNSLGWAIIIITIIVRIVLLWPQHKMMISQKKLQNIQPKIKELQEKHKWNQQALWMELMALYKKEKVNPMWACGFLLIQMPILLVLYHVIANITDLSTTYYLYSFLGDFKISDIIHNFYGFDLFWIWWIQWLVLALVVWLLQYIQIKLSLSYNPTTPSSGLVLEKKKWENDYSSFMPDPDMINKFMLYWMPVMVAIFTYTFFAWVGLYWGISTLFIIVQQMFVNKILKK